MKIVKMGAGNSKTDSDKSDTRPSIPDDKPSQSNKSYRTSNTPRGFRGSYKIDEDDCDLYAKLLACKLRQYSREERPRVMYLIDGMLLEIPPSSSLPEYQTKFDAEDKSQNKFDKVHITTPNIDFINY